MARFEKGKGGNPASRFKKGQSGNPGGRPKDGLGMRELARSYSTRAIETLVKVMENGRGKSSARVAAAVALLDRGFGRPEQFIAANLRVEAVKLPAAEELEERIRVAVAKVGRAPDGTALPVALKVRTSDPNALPADLKTDDKRSPVASFPEIMADLKAGLAPLPRVPPKDRLDGFRGADRPPRIEPDVP
jgi:hypothetical protein